jgi:hypothetical protein
VALLSLGIHGVERCTLVLRDSHCLAGACRIKEAIPRGSGWGSPLAGVAGVP